MNKADNEQRMENLSAHQFPSIRPSLEDPSGPNGSTNFSFRPLYQGSQDAAGGRLTKFKNKSIKEDGRRSIEDLKEDSSKRGIEAGRAEACNLVQQQLEEPIRKFKSETLQCQDCLTQISETYSDHIVQLTLAVAKCILGPGIEFGMAGQEQMRRQLRDLLKKQYQLVMKLNEDDRKTLSDIMSCEDPQWHQSPAMRIIGEAHTLKGEINIEAVEAAADRLKENFDQEFEALLPDR